MTKLPSFMFGFKGREVGGRASEHHPTSRRGHASQSYLQQHWRSFPAQLPVLTPRGGFRLCKLGIHFPFSSCREGPPTYVVDILVPIEAFGAIFKIALVEVYGPHDTLVPQVPHEQLQSDQGKNTQAEHCQDHHIGQLLHGLN